MFPIPNIPKLNSFTGFSFVLPPAGAGGENILHENGIFYMSTGTIGMQTVSNPLEENGIFYMSTGTIGMQTVSNPLEENGIIYRVTGGIS